MKKSLMIAVAIIAASFGMQVNACPIEIENDIKNDLFVIDPASYRAVYIPERGQNFGNHKMTIDPVKPMLGKEKLDFYVSVPREKAEKTEMRHFFYQFQLIEKKCKAAMHGMKQMPAGKHGAVTKLGFSEIEDMVDQTTDRFEIKRLKEIKAKGGANITLKNDAAFNVFVIDVISKHGMYLPKGKMHTLSAAVNDAKDAMIDVYIEKEKGHEKEKGRQRFYRRYTMKIKAGKHTMHVKEINEIVNKPTDKARAERLNEYKSGAKTTASTEQKYNEKEMEYIGLETE